MEVKNAFSVLSDAGKRAEYDRRLRYGVNGMTRRALVLIRREGERELCGALRCVGVVVLSYTLTRSCSCNARRTRPLAAAAAGARRAPAGAAAAAAALEAVARAGQPSSRRRTSTAW